MSKFLRVAALASAVVLASSCKAPTAGVVGPLRPVAPVDAFQKHAGTCSAVHPQMEPDLMGWDALSRANLNRLRRKGLVAVHYEGNGCEVQLELLPNCIAKGGYEFAPYSANEHKVAHDDDELYAALPLGAHQLAAKYAGGVALRTDYMLAGTYSIEPGTSVNETDLKGDECARATHVVSALFVGGFALAAGERRAIDVNAKVFGAGVGAGTHSALDTVVNEGDADACKHAQADGRESDQCSAPLRVGLLAIRRAATVDTQERTVALPALAAVPPAPVAQSTVTLNADADVLVAYDAALTADRTGTKNTPAAIKAWKAVATTKGKNPYVAVANERAQRWVEYAAKMQARKAQQAIDTDRLRKIAPLESVLPAQKEELFRDFVHLYGRLPASDLVARVKPEAAGKEMAARLAIPIGTFKQNVTGDLKEADVALKVLYRYKLNGKEAAALARECEAENGPSCEAMGFAYKSSLVVRMAESPLAFKDVADAHRRAAVEYLQRGCELGAKDSCVEKNRVLASSGTGDENVAAAHELEKSLGAKCEAGLTGPKGERDGAFAACRELREMYKKGVIADAAKQEKVTETIWRLNLRYCEELEYNYCEPIDKNCPIPEIVKRSNKVTSAKWEKECFEETDSVCIDLYKRRLKEGETELAKKAYVKGLDLARKGCAKGDASDCETEGEFYEASGDVKRAVGVWTTVCRTRYADPYSIPTRAIVCERVARIVNVGAAGVPANPATAQSLIEKACELAQTVTLKDECNLHL